MNLYALVHEWCHGTDRIRVYVLGLRISPGTKIKSKLFKNLLCIEENSEKLDPKAIFINSQFGVFLHFKLACVIEVGVYLKVRAAVMCTGY